MSDGELISPTVAALQQRLEAGDGDALGAFWRRLEAEGAPIVEPIDDEPAHRLVTFVYRSAEPLTNVAIFPAIERALEARANLMSRIADTDVWYRTYRARSDLRAEYRFSPNDPLRSLQEMVPDEMTRYQQERAKTSVADPLNPVQFGVDPGFAPSSVIELPDAPLQPSLVRRHGVPEGAIVREDIESDPFGVGRRIWTYLPPGYESARGPYPLLLQFDGWLSRKLGLHITLDNMIADGVIPPIVCVMVHNLDRNIELACNGPFADWLARELVPSWVRARYAVSDDPKKTVVTGMSLGGLASAFCGLMHPEVFGNVLSQSGSFWWPPDAGQHESLTAQYEAAPRLPLRFYMDVGLLEDGATPAGGPSMLETNRRLRDVLRGKGCDVRYAEYNGGHDYVNWRGTIADGLAFLFGN